MIIHDGRRYAIGTSDDTAVLGDWNCDGTTTPALLRSADSQVAVFHHWPPPDDVIAPSQVAVHPHARDLEVVSGPSCDRLRVIDTTGSRFFEETP